MIILNGFPKGLIFVFIILGVIILSLIASFFLSKKIRDMVFKRRYDDNGTLKYFYAEDFENLQVEPIEFVSEGNKIVGFIYSDYTLKEYKGIIVFSHGLGVGHNQYTTEIDHFAKRGYLVVSYDVSGTGKSEGKYINGITTALYNLRDCLSFIESHPVLFKYNKMVVGHSMGAYAANNITRYNQNLVGIVSMSSFDVPYKLLSEEIELMNGFEIKILTKMFKLLDKLEFGKDGALSSLDAFKNTDIRHLLISGNRDNIVDVSKNHFYFEEELKENENFKFLLVEDRYHRPNITKEAAKYDQETNMELNKLKSEYRNKVPKDILDEYSSSLDYNLLVELDDEVMKDIDNFIDECFKYTYLS